MKQVMITMMVFFSLYIGLIIRFKMEEISIKKFKFVFISIPFFLMSHPLVLFILAFKIAYFDKKYSFCESMKLSVSFTLKFSFEIEFWLKTFFLSMKQQEQEIKKYQTNKSIFKEIIPKYLVAVLIG